MSKQLTIKLSDEAYAVLLHAAARHNKFIDVLARDMLIEELARDLLAKTTIPS